MVPPPLELAVLLLKTYAQCAKEHWPIIPNIYGNQQRKGEDR